MPDILLKTLWENNYKHNFKFFPGGSMAFQAPNYTQIPNEIFDVWMNKLSPTSFKVLLCLCRKILGWHKTNDAISKNQIMKVCGLSKNTVQKALEDLISYDLIRKKQTKTEYGFQPNLYFLNIYKPEDNLYSDQNLDGGRSCDDRGVVQKMHQGVDQTMTPQKKDSTKERLTKEDIPSKVKKDASKEPPIKNDIVFNHSLEKFKGIREEDYKQWKELYANCDIKNEMMKMEQWILSEPKKAKLKKKWRKFINTWLSKADEKAFNKKAFNQSKSSNKNSSYNTNFNHDEYMSS